MENIERKTEIKISPGTPEDALGMQEVFYRTWLDTYPNAEYGITADDIEDRFKDAFSPETLTKKIEVLTNPPEGHTILFAKSGAQVIGVCRVIKLEHKNLLKIIYVLPEFQGKGIGHSLWEEAKKSIDQTIDTIVEVATYNTKAVSFYTKLGFVDTGLRFADERFKMKSGAIIPEMSMVKKAIKET